MNFHSMDQLIPGQDYKNAILCLIRYMVQFVTGRRHPHAYGELECEQRQ